MRNLPLANRFLCIGPSSATPYFMTASPSPSSPPPQPDSGLAALLGITCVEPDKHISAFGACLGFFLAAAAIVAIAPQYLKIIRLRSSYGLSPITMVTVVAHNTFVFADTIIVKWKIVQSCSTEGAFHCTLRLLDCAQLALTVLTQQGLLFLITAYAPNTLIHYRIVAAASAVAAAGLVASAPVVSNRGTCTQPTLVVAGVYSLSASFLVMCAYVPQLFETYRVGGAYSLSYATTFMLGLGR